MTGPQSLDEWAAHGLRHGGHSLAETLAHYAEQAEQADRRVDDAALPVWIVSAGKVPLLDRLRAMFNR